MMWIDSTKNMTNAQRALSVLSAGGISAAVVGLDPSMTKNGCAYGVSFPCAAAGEAERLLRTKNVSYGEIIGR